MPAAELFSVSSLSRQINKFRRKRNNLSQQIRLSFRRFLGNVLRSQQVAASEGSKMANWSELPHDLLVFIAQRLKKLKDFVAFGAVCQSWHTASKREYFEGLQQHTPYFMLPVKDDNEDVREVYSLIEGDIVARLKVPDFKSKMCYESLGWLLTLQDDGCMSLLNPFTEAEIPVAHAWTFPEDETVADQYYFLNKMVLSSRPSDTSNFILMIICEGFAYLGYWRLGDESWNRLDDSPHMFYTDVTYHDGHFYAIDYSGFVMDFKFEGETPTKGRIITQVMDDPADHVRVWRNGLAVYDKTLYILKTSESLFIISRHTFQWSETQDTKYHTTTFHLYEVDMSMGTWKKKNSLGSMAILVGQNSTTVVDASKLGSFEANHIYFTDDTEEFYPTEGVKDGNNMGIYNMETATFRPFYDGEVCFRISPAIWITPCF